MKSVKARALSSLFGVLGGMLGALALGGCLAEAAPGEPEGTVVEKAPAAAPVGGAAANNERAVETSNARTPVPLAPWQEPLPNPWTPPIDGVGVGPLPQAAPPDPAPLPGPLMNHHDPLETPEMERYFGPTGNQAW